MAWAQPQRTARTNNDDRLWSIGDVSRFLGIPVNTLYQWRHQGAGPRAYRVGRHLRYDPAEVRRWLVEGAA
jgi:excisionase family DNA binding protein